MISNRFFYEGENGNEGGGAAIAEPIVETPVAEQVAEAPKVETPVIGLDQMKQWGFDSVEQMQKHFEEQKKQNVSEEEKRKQAELEDADFRKYAIEKDLMKSTDFATYETLTQKQAVDLVFEKHLAEFKEDNPEITDEQELKEAAKADFNATYKLDSQSESVQKRGLAKIEKEAQELKSPVESKFTNAKQQYETHKSVNAKFPEFSETLINKIKQNTPDKAIIYKVKDGDVEIPVEIELTEDDRKEMAKAFSTPKTFQEYQSLSKEDFEAKMDRKQQAWVKVNKAEQIYSKAVEVGIGIGKAKGSNVGAEAPFALVDKGSNQSATATKTLDEEIAESHQRAARGYIK